MKLTFEINQKELRKIIADYIADRINMRPDDDLIYIQVKSQQNYKSEWETADFRAKYEYDI